MGVGRLTTRAVIGGLFVGHGTQKLFGWFGGPGHAGTQGMMTAIGLRPAKLHALMAGITETAGGALLAAGLATPLASATLTGVMATAIRKVHLKNGPWVTQGGWEYNATIIAALLTLAEVGPGELSLDHVLGIDRHGPAIALSALGVGVAAAAATMAAGSRGTEQGPPPEEPEIGRTAGDPATARA